MFGFLATISRAGLLDQVVWSEPEDLLAGCNHSLLELFAESGKTALLKAMKKCSTSEEGFGCEPSARLAGNTTDMTVCVLAMDQVYLVYATEDRLNKRNARNKGFLESTQLLMCLIMSYMAGGATLEPKTSHPHLDIIQSLTSELRSRKKQMEETNAQINVINQELNSRLGKDVLTGLVSRYQYRSEIEYAIANHPGKLGIFIFLDIDNFKRINDTYGHAAGDQYLIEFSERLKKIPVEDAILMRIAGDEFGMFIYDLDDAQPQRMEKLWRYIKDYVLYGPMEIGMRRLSITVSAGMAIYGVDTTDAYELIELADKAMYVAKKGGKNCYSVYGSEKNGKKSG